MASFLNKFLPISPPSSHDVDDYSVEYSFAIEYNGPPVAYDIPRAVPVDIDSIPTAPVAVPASMLNSLTVPTIRPIVKKSDRALNEKLSTDSKSRSAVTVCLSSSDFDGLGKGGGHVVSGKPLEGIDRSGVFGSGEGNDVTPNVLDEIESSGTLGFSDSHDGSRELSGSSDIERLQDDGKADWDLNESPRISSEISICETEGCIDETPCHLNGTCSVTSHGSESSDIVPEETYHGERKIIKRREGSKDNVKKGLCHRCHKGSRFTEKEVCIVCCAKYCANCLLRAMGSMPEGRKCISCIGSPIDESRRGSLGKCSGMLKRLLTDMQVKLIMNSEILCQTNQLPPEFVCVNGQPLCQEEFVVLQSCPNPPKRLKPGMYWYDKVSGFWGKVGQKPCQIISPQLAVGGVLMRDASHGNTNILINNREITRAELWVLKLAGIRCEGNPHYWLSSDGTYQEEGQKNLMGRIWDKAGIKLFCLALSLPIPPESVSPSGEEEDKLADGVAMNYLEQKTPSKLLLVGHNNSGTSTIYKQARIMYDVPFSEDERQSIKSRIQSNLYAYLGILLEGRERFEEDWSNEMRKKHNEQGNSSQIVEQNVYSIGPKLKAFSDWLLQVIVSGNLEVMFPAATREYAPLVDELWKDRAFQATYNRRNELQMLDGAANYFLNRASEISRPDYEPSDIDILYANGITLSKGVASMEFLFPNPTQDSFLDAADQYDPLLRHQLIRVPASSLGENCKWLSMFEDVDLILFCVSLIDYDQFDDNGGVCKNKMLVSKELFERIVTHPTFCKKNFLLILNKFDLLEEKIENVPLTECEWFCDFNPVISVNQCSSSTSNNPSLAQRAFHYIAAKFKRLFRSLHEGKLYVSLVTGLESDSVDEALRYAREILKWEDEKPTIFEEILSPEISSSS